MTGLRALALDFGGTLARPGPSTDGRTVAKALRELPGAVVPERFAETFDAVARRMRRADREGSRQTPFPRQLGQTADECHAILPDLVRAWEAVFTAVPDADIDLDAARTLRELHESGWVCVLACDTQRPEIVRRRTLQAAGILDCFEALVLSSVVGVRKPHPAFFAAVAEAAGCLPGEILFVGDTRAKDVVAPIEYGMRAVLVAADRPTNLDPSILVIRHLAELPSQLEALDDR
ncbi:HAD family hydrolase [Sphaerisporangium sp. NPDC051017]|uniref:HAD family hydrolase n=1 Tax=Sphaerisporangium sp. NPDC051017 TaxID=3154636 RepID=UPI0034472549